MTYVALAIFFAVAASVGVVIEYRLGRDDRKARGLRAANRDGRGEGKP